MKPWSGIILVVVLIGLVSAPALARDEVLVSGPLEYGGYGGPAIRVAGLKGETGIFVGGYGGWVINHTFMFGGGGYGLLNEVKAPFSGKQGEPVYFKMGYGGLVFEYVNNSHRLWHWTVHTLIGMGGIELTSKEDWSFKYDDSFLIIEPSICVELNVTTNFRASLGVGYRHIDGVNLSGITDEDLKGVVTSLNLKFGVF